MSQIASPVSKSIDLKQRDIQAMYTPILRNKRNLQKHVQINSHISRIPNVTDTRSLDERAFTKVQNTERHIGHLHDSRANNEGK